MITARVFVDGKVSDEQVDPADATAVLARDDAFLWLDASIPRTTTWRSCRRRSACTR